ncbi:MAG: hypothetical protein Q8O00_09250 [Holophaga sp.]|nr:hypothetical protein [Holophaga sp.]
MTFPKSRLTKAPQVKSATPVHIGEPGSVRVQKRDNAAAPTLREKLCATCGKAFKLQPDEKFFDCPTCYRKNQTPRPPRKRGEARVLVQITCVACGTVEFLGFAPTDPANALCRSCFATQKREQKLASPHTKHR